MRTRNKNFQEKSAALILITRSREKRELTDAFMAVHQSESLVAGADGMAVNFVAIVLAGYLGAYPVWVLLDLTLWHLSEPLTIPAD